MSNMPQVRINKESRTIPLVRQSHIFSSNSRTIVHVTVIALDQLHLVQLLDCYWYNYVA